MASVGIGTKVFKRTNEVRELLKTLPEGVFDTIYIADDGKITPEKEVLYDDFDVELIDLDYDSGLSVGRNAIVNRSTEDFLCIVDPDHRVPRKVTDLIRQLEAMPHVGGIGGALVEPDTDQIIFEGHDFAERGGALIRSAKLQDKTVDVSAGSPFIRFDFIPNAAVFRRDVLANFPWDVSFIIEGEHLDFYLNHWKQSNWDFGINPAVQFIHYPGGDAEYESERHDADKTATSKAYFLKKWGYDSITIDDYAWIRIYGTRRAQLSLSNKVRLRLAEEGLGPLLKEVPRYIKAEIRDRRNSEW